MASCGQQQQQLVGGKRMATKKTADKQEKQVKQQQQQQQKPKQKQAEKKSSTEKRASPSSSSKKGGSLVQDIKTLALPFALLLAKEGLGKTLKKDAKPQESMAPRRAAKPSSSRRRTTLSGGSCNLGCGMSGGQAAKELFQLQTEIDNFLQRY